MNDKTASCIVTFEDDVHEDFIERIIGSIKMIRGIENVELFAEAKKPPMKDLRVDIFKPSGKYYTDEYIGVPGDIKDFNLPEYVEQNARIRNMTYLFNGLHYDIPYLVHLGD